MVEFWEPWIPDLGERVRYRYRPECPGVYGMIAPVGHPPEYDGLVGVMYESFLYGLNERGNGHRFLVRLDNGRHIMAAALELEPATPFKGLRWSTAPVVVGRRWA